MNRISHFLAAALFVAQIVNITPIDQKYQIKLDAPESIGDSYHLETTVTESTNKIVTATGQFLHKNGKRGQDPTDSRCHH